MAAPEASVHRLKIFLVAILPSTHERKLFADFIKKDVVAQKLNYNLACDLQLQVLLKLNGYLTI